MGHLPVLIPALTALVAVLTFSHIPSTQGATNLELYSLHDYLFGNGSYKKEVRPVEVDSTALYVYMSFSLLSLVDVNEKDQTLTTNALLEMTWSDQLLTWAPANYGNATSIMVHQEDIWLPDVQVGNSVILQKQLGYKQLPVRLKYDGWIEWNPTTVITTSCDIDVTYYPMDTQTCFILFETLQSKSTEIDINVDTNLPLSLTEYNEDGQWELKDTYSENLSVEDSKAKIKFSLLLKRRQTYYVVNIILPIIFLSFTSTLVFALPADSGEKMSMGITVLLAYAVYLTIVADHLPNTSVQTSILAVYLTTLLGITAVAIVVSALILRLHHRSHGSRVGSRTVSCILLIKTITFNLTEEDKHLPQNSISPEDSRLQSKGSQAFQVSTSYLSAIELNNQAKRKEKKDTSTTTNNYRLHQKDPKVDLNRPVSCPPVYQKPMTWQEVAQALDWFMFLLFTILTELLTLVSMLYLSIGAVQKAPELDKS